MKFLTLAFFFFPFSGMSQTIDSIAYTAEGALFPAYYALRKKETADKKSCEDFKKFVKKTVR